MANTIYCVIINLRIPPFLPLKSDHVFIVWQHNIVLLIIRQVCEGKSYRMFVECPLKPIT